MCIRDRDEELLALLERVNLPELVTRFGGLDTELDWAKVLSVGEQQLSLIHISEPTRPY